MPALFNDIARIWLLNIAIVLPAYAAFAFGVWLVLWVLLRRKLASRKIREDAPPYRQLITEFLYSVRSVAIFATISVAGAFLIRGGFYPLSDLSGHWGPIWFWVSLALMIVGQDTYIYWIHRWMHRSRWYRRLHRRHHLSHNPSPFAAYSFDIGEALLMTAFPFLWPLVIPTPWAVSLLFLIHQIFRNTLLHAGYELMPARADGRPWFDWMTTTTHHDTPRPASRSAEIQFRILVHLVGSLDEDGAPGVPSALCRRRSDRRATSCWAVRPRRRGLTCA